MNLGPPQAPARPLEVLAAAGARNGVLSSPSPGMARSGGRRAVVVPRVAAATAAAMRHFPSRRVRRRG